MSISQAFEWFDELEGPASAADISRLEARVRMSLPPELKDMYLSFGWGAGFAGRAGDEVADEDLPDFIVIWPPDEVETEVLSDTGKKVLLIGGDGAAERIVMYENGEVGFLGNLDHEEKYVLARCDSLETFFAKASRGALMV